MLLVGCKTDLRQDREVLAKLEEGRLEPISYQQASATTPMCRRCPPAQAGGAIWGPQGGLTPRLPAGRGHGPAGPRRVLRGVLGQVPGERRGHLRQGLRCRPQRRAPQPAQEATPEGLRALLTPTTTPTAPATAPGTCCRPHPNGTSAPHCCQTAAVTLLSPPGHRGCQQGSTHPARRNCPPAMSPSAQMGLGELMGGGVVPSRWQASVGEGTLRDTGGQSCH